MSKKIMTFVLGLGLLAIVGLGAFFYMKNKEISNSIELSINKQLEKVFSHLPVTWEPFECRGLTTISCSSKEISYTIPEFNDDTKVILHNATIDFDLKSDTTLDIVADIKNIEFKIGEHTDKADSTIAQARNFLPSTAKCRYKLEQKDDSLLSTANECVVQTPNADYELNATNIYEISKIEGLNILQIMNTLYDQIVLGDNSNLYIAYGLKNFSFGIKDHGLSKDIFKIYANSLAYGGYEHADKAAYIERLQGIRSFSSDIANFMGKKHKKQIENAADGLIALLSEKNNYLKIQLNFNSDKELELRTPLRLQMALLEGSFWEDYELDVYSK